MFNFDVAGLSNFKYFGTIYVSVSDGFSNYDYLLGLVNSTDFTMNPYSNEIYWSPEVINNIQNTLNILSSFANLPFSSVANYDTSGSFGQYSIASPADVGALSNINISYMNANSRSLLGISSLYNDSFGYYESSGDIFINYTGTTFASEGVTFADFTKSRQVLLHELCHSLGLSHPFNNGSITSDYSALVNVGFQNLGFAINSGADLDKEYFSIMSYDDESNISFNNAYTPMILDVIALQGAYGEGAGTSGTGNDVIQAGNFGYRTYFDTGGTDTINASLYESGCYFNMGTSIVGASHQVGLITSYEDAVSLFNGSSPQSLRWLYGEYENAIGSIASDGIYGNSLNNIIQAGGGNDYVRGGGGNDTIDCGDGLGDICGYNLYRSNYTITYFNSIFTVTALSGTEGVDTVTGVESFQFSDQTIAASNFIDSITPTISMGANDTSLKVGETTSINFTLSESSSDFIVDDIFVSGGSLSNFTGSGTNYSATFTPTPNSTLNGVVSVGSAKFSDAGGNANADGSDSDNTVTMTVDTIRPTIIVVSPYNGAVGVQPRSFYDFDVNFSELVALGPGSITLKKSNGDMVETFNAATSNAISFYNNDHIVLTPSVSLDYATTYQLTFDDNSVLDLAGNQLVGGIATEFSTIARVSAPPTISISSNDSALKAGETAVISFTLSESSTDFIFEDIFVSGGSLSNFSGSGTNYTALFTPTTNSTTNGLVSVANTKFTDAAGNSNTDASDSDNAVTITVDTIPNVSPTGLVKIVGTATQKQVLTASNTLADSDGLGAITYQWLADNVAISGATASTYTLTQSEVGKIIKVTVSYVDGRGQSESVTSATPTKAVLNVNDAPTLVNALSDQSATEGAAFTLTVPSNTFTDIDTGDTFKLSATLASNAALPKWLKFNATTGVFSGTPLDADSATSITVRVTGTDKARATAYDDFILNITGVNVAPTAKAITKVATATEGKAFKYALPKGTFTDGDKNDALTYSTTSKPDWLSIDSAGNLTGMPSYAAADSSTASVVYVATDRAGLSTSTTLTIKLTNTATIKGTANAETIVAGAGADKITGVAGDDTITGGADNDTISGGAGNDTLTGGSGNDYFLFDIAANATSNLDTITDFVSGADKLQFSKKVFAGLGKAVGSLTDAQFAYSTESLTTTDRIIYNTSTGALYYDADGSGTGSSAVQVALIGATNHPILSYSDIQIGA